MHINQQRKKRYTELNKSLRQWSKVTVSCWLCTGVLRMFPMGKPNWKEGPRDDFCMSATNSTHYIKIYMVAIKMIVLDRHKIQILLRLNISKCGWG